MKKTTIKKDEFNRGEIIIYKTTKNEVELEVQFKEEAIWLRQREIATLFGKERSVIAKHIKAIFSDKEIDEKSNVHFLHIANSDKPVMFYGLDVILAVGYRTNSARAIHFRKWATNVLRKYLLQGYVINEKRLMEAQEKFNELKMTIDFLQKKSKKELLAGQSGEILNLLSAYAKTLTMLEQYDKGSLKEMKDGKTKFVLSYKKCLQVIAESKVY